MSTIIALIGRKGSGKSTLAREIQAVDKNVRVCSFATPLKRLAINMFRLNPEHVHGPSHLREEKVPQSTEYQYWCDVRSWGYAERDRLAQLFPGMFVGNVLAKLGDVLDTLYSEAILYNGVTVRRVLELLGTDWGRALDSTVWVRQFVAELGNADTIVVDDARFVDEVRALRATEERNTVRAYYLDAGGRLPPLAPDAHASEPRPEDFRDIVDEVLDVAGPDKDQAHFHAVRILQSLQSMGV